MKRTAWWLLALTLGTLGAPSPASAWEPETTHAGLAEQAALASRLHKRLVTLGFGGGLFEPLTIPPADAPKLIAALRLLSPTHGAVPDGRGRQVALAWLAAGASLADTPSSHGANHFLEVSTGRGWRRPGRGALAALSDTVREVIGRASVPDRGIAAPDWIVAADNPFSVERFLEQYAKAVTAATPGERSRHMAAALVAAGAILHALGDVGAPSRARGDEAAHFEPLGGGADDLGSRFERIAALAYGRLGVPPPSRVITRTKLRDFFTSKNQSGLADLVARAYFSTNTLPKPFAVTNRKPPLARPLPELPELNLMAAVRDEGNPLYNSAGTCLAHYKVDRGMVSFWLDDECMLEQVTAILPEVAAYETGLLEFLLRGELAIHVGDTIAVTGKGLGAGTVELFVEDARGVRSQLASSKHGGGRAQLLSVAAPSAGSRVVAIFRGADTEGEPIVAVGAMPLGR